MHIITNPFFYLIAIPVVLLAGMSKGGLGPIAVAIAVPALSFVISPLEAAGIMLPILCFMDFLALLTFRRKFSPYHLAIIIPAGVVGIVISSFLIGKIPENDIKVIIGIIVIWFCLDYWFRGNRVKEKKGGKISGIFWGSVAGFTSTQIHAGGPPISIYLLPQRLDKTVLMGTLAVFFACMNYIKLIPYSMLGLLTMHNFLTSLLLMPLAPIGVRLGYFVLQRVKQKNIYRFLYIVLFLAGLKMFTAGF